MRRCHPGASIVPELKSMRLELSLFMSSSNLQPIENGDGLAMATFLFLLMDIMEKVEKLAKEVEELGELASFRTQALICPSSL